MFSLLLLSQFAYKGCERVQLLMAELKTAAEATGEDTQRAGWGGDWKQGLKQASHKVPFLIFQKLWVQYTNNSQHQIPAECVYLENSLKILRNTEFLVKNIFLIHIFPQTILLEHF